MLLFIIFNKNYIFRNSIKYFIFLYEIIQFIYFIYFINYLSY